MITITGQPLQVVSMARRGYSPLLPFSVALLFGLLFLAASAQAQEPSAAKAQVRPAPAPEEVCILEGDEHNAYAYVPRMVSASKGAETASATFSVTFVDDPVSWPATAQTAFNYAADLWADAISSAVTINVEARWKELGDCSGSSFPLGSAGSMFIHRNFTGAPESDTWYPDALADALYGSSIAGGNFDILSQYNSQCGPEPGDADRWYFGTDGNTPSGKVDFVSVVLHEIGHGLGFIGTADVDDGVSPNECNGTAGDGCIEYSNSPYIYDRFTEDGPGTALRSMDNPSATLGTALTGGSGGVFFDGPLTTLHNGLTPARLYAPSTWSGGSSFSHLDESTFNGTPSALMTPFLSFAESNHSPGAVGCALLEDIGWTLGADCQSVLPVELTAFDAVVDLATVLLHWETASETNNAGFQVEQRYFDGAFESVDFVAGAGTTLEAQHYTYRAENLDPGRHVFRLKQIDFDGTFEVHPEVEVFVELPGTYALSGAFPNPFNPETQVTLMVAVAQPVRVEVYDVVGRRVAVLHDGLLEADQLHRFVFDARRLPSGLYLYRILGERFSDVKSMMLVK